MVRVARYARHTWIVATVSALAVATMTQSVGAQSDPQAAVNAADAKFKDLREGKNADYIPALAKVDPCSALRSSLPTARCTRPVISRPRCRSSR